MWQLETLSLLIGGRGSRFLQENLVILTFFTPWIYPIYIKNTKDDMSSKPLRFSLVDWLWNPRKHFRRAVFGGKWRNSPPSQGPFQPPSVQDRSELFWNALRNRERERERDSVCVCGFVFINKFIYSLFNSMDAFGRWPLFKTLTILRGILIISPFYGGEDVYGKYV